MLKARQSVFTLLVLLLLTAARWAGAEVVNPTDPAGIPNFGPMDCRLPHLQYKTFQAKSAASGNTAYTVPAGKRWLFIQGAVYNPTGGSITLIPQVIIGGSTYAEDTSGISGTSLGAGVASQTVLTTAYNMIHEPADVLNFNTSGAGLAWWFTVAEFDTSGELFSPRLTDATLATGDNVLYTCPTGFFAVMTSHNSTNVNVYGMSFGPFAGTLRWDNQSGGSRTYYSNYVVSGDTASAPGTNSNALTTGSNSIGNGTNGTTGGTFNGGFNAGDSLHVHVDAVTARQLIYCVVIQKPIQP